MDADTPAKKRGPYKKASSMTIGLRPMGVFVGWALMLASAPVRSDTLSDLTKIGYQTLWTGYAAITTCVAGQDRYPLGSYIFVCENYDYPYHYGNVTLVGQAFDYQGQRLVITRLCLDDSKPCLRGSTFHKP